MSTSIVHGSLRAVLCAGLSIAALSIAAPARAADLESPFVKAPVRGETRMYLEGGVFWTGGDRIQYGNGDPFFGGKTIGDPGGPLPLPPNGVFPPCEAVAAVCDSGSDPSVRPKLGIDGAIGFDHRFAGTRWHVNGEGRAGVSQGTSSFTDAFAFSTTSGGGLAFSASATGEAKLTEWHWHTDLGIGYDIISGRAPLQIKFGVRIAEVAATNKITTNGAFSVQAPLGTTVVTATTNDLTTDRRSFLGAGPRIGMEGEVPLYSGWTLDYKGDAAILFGNTKIQSESVTSFAISGGGFSASGTFNSNNDYWTKSIYVWNFDLQAGIGYWFSPNTKLSLSYRVDAFLDALRQSRDDTLPGRSIDRYYHGPKVTLTSRWN